MSVTAAKGFTAVGVHAGIRRNGLDLAVVRSTTPAVGAAMFTVNQVLAAPVVVGKLTASALALGRDFSLASSSDGVRGWGQNAFGQLGTGTSTAASEPTPSSGVRNARPSLLVSGPTASHACALIDGALACWGANALSALGDGTALDRYQAALTAFPLEVVLSAQPGSLALGKAHTCALDASGSIWCWGASQRRQLGRDVPPGSAVTPVRVY